MNEIICQAKIYDIICNSKKLHNMDHLIHTFALQWRPLLQERC